jgi:hypothetical protein
VVEWLAALADPLPGAACTPFKAAVCSGVMKCACAKGPVAEIRGPGDEVRGSCWPTQDLSSDGTSIGRVPLQTWSVGQRQLDKLKHLMLVSDLGGGSNSSLVDYVSREQSVNWCDAEKNHIQWP